MFLIFWLVIEKMIYFSKRGGIFRVLSINNIILNKTIVVNQFYNFKNIFIIYKYLVSYSSTLKYEYLIIL